MRSRRGSDGLGLWQAALGSLLAGLWLLPAQASGYRHVELLQQARLQYAALAAQPRFNDLPALPARSLRAGDRYAGAGALRKTLRQLGDLPTAEAAPVPDDSLDAALMLGLQRFQARHGLAPDGVLGPATWHALAVPMSQRLAQIDLTLTRLNQLPAPTQDPFIVVNIPQYRLFAFSGGADAEQDMLAMDVIVGRSLPTQRTPVFWAELRQVVFRPYWDVPRSILLHEILPDLRRDSGLAERLGYEAVDGQADESPVVPWSAAVLEGLARGDLRLRQRPGASNPLGPVKFLLPNDHAVYLHSTSAPQLFGQVRRAFSHGCVRVSDAEALAVWVLKDDPAWTRERVAAALACEGLPERVPLQRSVRVLLVYATAVATEDGRVLFFDDVYGHDRREAAALHRQVDSQPAQ